MPPIYVSFFTRDNGYEAEARELVRTLAEFGLPCDVQGVRPLSNWQAATQHKAVFIRQMMTVHAGRPIIWLDADARVMARPDLFFTDVEGADFAAHWLGGRELLSSTLYFANTLASWRIVDRWIERNRQNPAGINGDQMNLQDVAEDHDDFALFCLPPEYAWIQRVAGLMDISESHYGKRNPVIRQTQASRKLKR